jgi:hypothetical protein
MLEKWISPIAWSPLDEFRGSGHLRLKNNLPFRSRMKTVKYTEEQRKERRVTRNKNYYTKNKEFWTEYNGSTFSVYVLSGFANNMVWIGVTRTLKRHLAEHKKTFGEGITAEVLFTIEKDLTPENQADLLALLARKYSSRCLNAVKTSDTDFSQVEERMKPILSELSAENQNILKIDCVPA